MGEGDARRDREAARVATSTAGPAFEGRSATKDEDCDAGAECGARDAAICLAMAVREGHRALLLRRRGAGGRDGGSEPYR